MKVRSSVLVALIAALGIATPLTPANAAPGDLFVQVSIEFGDPNDPNDPNSPEACSIMRVAPNGTATEWVSNAQILAATGEIAANCDDTAITAAVDGTLYFAEDVSHDILRVSPAGVVDVFVARAAIDAVIGTSSDIDNGMTLGSDGNLYAADEDCDCVIRIDVPAGTVSIVVSEAAIAAITGSSPDLEGGIARDNAGNLYFVDDTEDVLLRRTPAGVVSIFAPTSAFNAATGDSGADLDVAVVIGNALFVADDDDGILRVDLGTGAVSLLASEAAINAATENSDADLEGGLAIDTAGNVYIGDDGSGCGTPTAFGECPSIARVSPGGTVSSFLSTTALQSYVTSRYASGVATLEGGMVIQPLDTVADVAPAPATSATGLVVLAIILLLAAGHRLTSPAADA